LDNTVARLHACVHFVQTAVSPRSRSRAWIGEVRGVIAELEKLNQTTEASFLAVGGNLMDFLSASRQLHADIGGLTALVSGERTRQACNTLTSVRRHVREIQNRCAHGGRALLALQSSAGNIRRGFSTLGKIALSFHIAAILARIETAHLSLSQQDLGNLADEVRSCSDGIEERGEQILDAAAHFDARITTSLVEVSRLDAIQRKELPALLAEVDADLATFEARQRDAACASSSLAADLDSVGRDLGAIATSIQFHDITRQQLEHVIEALSGLVRDTARGTILPSGASLAKLQKAQLKSAAAAFAQSAQKIDRDLDSIAARVGEMAGASQRILGVDNREKNSFLDDMQGRFATILRAVGEAHSWERTTRSIIAELEKLSYRLRASVTEVQAIELQLSRISINAAISASHIGAPGEPLNVVAGSMQMLQMECASRSRDAAVDLDSIGESIASLTDGGVHSADADSSAVLVAGLRNSLDELGTASVSSADAAACVAKLAGALCGNLQAARGYAGIGLMFVETVSRCCDVLDRVAARAQPVWLHGLRKFHAPVIEDEQRYTMQAERDVHDAETGVVSQSCEAPPSDSADDVEFF
jgi:hypothetical protein